MTGGPLDRGEVTQTLTEARPGSKQTTNCNTNMSTPTHQHLPTSSCLPTHHKVLNFQFSYMKEEPVEITILTIVSARKQRRRRKWKSLIMTIILCHVSCHNVTWRPYMSYMGSWIVTLSTFNKHFIKITSQTVSWQTLCPSIISGLQDWPEHIA